MHHTIETVAKLRRADFLRIARAHRRQSIRELKTRFDKRRLTVELDPVGSQQLRSHTQALRLGQRAVGFAACLRDLLVGLLGCLVDHPLALLARLVDLVEGGLHRSGRHDVLQFHRDHVDAVVVGAHRLLDLVARQCGDRHARGGQHLAAEAVADHPAHHRLADVAQGAVRIALLVEVFHRVGDAVLHHPLDIDDVEIARQHQRLVRKVLAGIGRALVLAAGGAEAELLLHHALGGDFLHLVDAEGQFEMQPGFIDVDHLAEALDHGTLFRLHRVIGAGHAPDDEAKDDDHHQRIAA